MWLRLVVCTRSGTPSCTDQRLRTCCGEIRLLPAIARTTASWRQGSPMGCAATSTTPAAAREEREAAPGMDGNGAPMAQGERRTCATSLPGIASPAVPTAAAIPAAFAEATDTSHSSAVNGAVASHALADTSPVPEAPPGRPDTPFNVSSADASREASADRYKSSACSPIARRRGCNDTAEGPMAARVCGERRRSAGHALLITKRSSRATPDARTPSPTATSVP
mmetsp:Transcript_34007/g.109873  ORF Transcript_34007/g.109873 Transcript_34007/m.109873 type:complete len:224 (-) Transcript_34007:390-1061(-)